MAEGAAIMSASIFATSSASLMSGTSEPSGVAGSVELKVSAVAEAEDLVKAERTPRKVILCPQGSYQLSLAP